MEITQQNRSFLYGDSVTVFFYVHQGKLIFSEESYFYLMASMRKMRMLIPLSYTLEYFEQILNTQLQERKSSEGIFNFMVYRKEGFASLEKAEVNFSIGFYELNDLLSLQGPLNLDLIREIHLSSNLFSGIHVHKGENIYASIYSQQNDLGDVIFLNENKRIARAGIGNLLFLQDGVLRIPKQSEGAYISPLMEAFVTFIHKNNLAQVDPTELAPFESQKAQEILLISDEKGLFPVQQIRNKVFAYSQIEQWVQQWKNSLVLSV